MHPSLQLGRRFGAALALLLVLCTILTTVSVLQARQLGAPDTTVAAPAVVDPVAPIRQTLRQLDQVRGLEAMHLLVRSAAEKRAIEADVSARRHAIDILLTQCQPLAGDSVDLQFDAGARADLAAYWAQQEQLLELSRRALTDSVAATPARQLLGGASQASFERLRQRLERWWTHREARAREAVQAQRAQTARVLWQIALLGVLALGTGIALWWTPERRPTSVRATDGAIPALAASVDVAPATQSRVQQVQTLIDAVRAGSAAAPRDEAVSSAATD